MTIEEIDAEIAALREVKRARLKGEVRSKVGYAGGLIEKSLPTLAEIEEEIARLMVERTRLAGGCSRLGPVRVGFGSRP